MPEHAPIFMKGVPGYDGFTRIAGCTCGWQCPSSEQDSDEAFVWHLAAERGGNPNAEALGVGAQWKAIFKGVASAAVQRSLHAELAATAVAWATADRLADDRAADLMRLQDEVQALPQRPSLDTNRDALLASYARAEADFHRADQIAVTCDEAFRQAARKLAETAARTEESA